MLETFRQDLRYAIRGLRAKPGFASAVVITLALGIGANAAMFGIVDRMLFRPPPMMRDPASVHRVYPFITFRGKERQSGGQYARYVSLATGTTSFSRSAGYTERELAVGIGEASRSMQIGVVSATFFGFFDAPPVLGRYFTTAEDQPPAGTPVVVLSNTYWETQFGARRDVLGTKIQIGSVVYTVIGVAPRGFVGLWPDQPPAAYIPITNYGASSQPPKMSETWWKTYHWGWMSMIARRKPGVSIERANTDLTAAMQRSYQAQLAESPKNTPMALAKPRAIAGSIMTERGPNQSSVAKVATWLGGVSLIVLLIACANVANLLLARAIRRRREIAVRLALGVSQGRLLSQLLTESVLLAILGGVAGVVVAQWGGAALRAGLLPKTAPTHVFTDARTLVFTGVAALVVGLLTGLAPTFQAARTDLTNDLKSGAREGTFHRSRARVTLLVLQGALSVVLLVGAGLFVRSLRNVQSMRLGYDVDPLTLVDLRMRGVQLDSVHMVELKQRLLGAVKTIPGVENASSTAAVPFWSTWSIGLWVEGIDTVSRLGEFDLNSVSPEYFKTLGTRIVRGRGLTDADNANAPRAIVVSESMAKTVWPGRDAVGQCIRLDKATAPCTYVVGIAEDIKASSLSDDPGLYYYLPAAQFHPEQGGLFVRTKGDASRFTETIRRQLQHEMPGVSYVTVTPFAEVVGSQTKSFELGATMFAAFGALALLLAGIGLYSVIAYNVAQRTHELGVRVALGARMADVIRLVLGEGLRLGVSGVAIGGLAAFLAGRWVKPLLFNESPKDPVVFGVVATVLIVVTVAASLVPAHRAARVDPQAALRSD
jgi:predicted permease